MPTYKFETPIGTYKVEAADDAQAHRIGAFIQDQVSKGATDLSNAKWPEPVHYRAADNRNAMGVGLHGATKEAGFNLTDEASGALAALIPGYAQLDNWANPDHEQTRGGIGADLSFWDAVKQNVANLQRSNQTEEAAHPVANAVGRITGAVAGGGLAAKGIERGAGMAAPYVARALPRAAIGPMAAMEAAALNSPRIATAIKGTGAGATYGGVSGYGAGDTAENRSKSAGTGMMAGGALGGTVSTAITTLGPAVARYASIMFGRAPEQEAIQQIVEKLAQDGYDVTSPSNVMALRAELSKYTGKPVALADIGAATRARAGVGLRAPSAFQQQAEDIVTQRTAGQGPRLVGDIKQFVAPRTDIHAIDENLVNQLDTEALPMRDKALFERRVTPPEIPTLPAPELPPLPPHFDLPPTVPLEEPAEGLTRFLGNAPAIGKLKPMDDTFFAQLAAKAEPEPTPFVEPTPPPPALPPEPFGPPAPTIEPRVPRMIEDPQLNALLNEHPLGQKALRAATKTLNAERATNELQGLPTDHLPEVLAGQQLDYRTADYVKRFLDDQVNRLYSNQTSSFSPAEAGQVKGLRDAIRTRARDSNDEYGQYLDMYSGTSDMRNALKDGRGFLQLDPEQIAAEQADRSLGAQELYRVGAARNLADTVNMTNEGGFPADRLLKSPEAQARLGATGVEDMPGFMERISQERTLNRLHKEMQGSPTQQRQAAAADAEAGASAHLPFNPTSKWAWLGAAGRAVLNKTSTARNAAVNAALLPRLLETNPAARDSIIAELEASGHKLLAAKIRRTVRARKAARTAGMVIGSPVSLQEEQ